MNSTIKSAFTSFPYCLATYVTLVGLVWLLAAGWKPPIVPLELIIDRDYLAKAESRAKQEGGTTYLVAPTGSMRPALQADDIVVVKKIPFADIKVGDVILYHATWRPDGSPPVCHRAVQKDKYGWIMSGDSADRTESFARVTKDNYVGKVMAVYRKSR